MSNVHDLAQQTAADGLVPPKFLKNVLVGQLTQLPVSVNSTTKVFDPNISRALFHEAVVYFFRSLSQLVGYEASYQRRQLSWAGVTLYYSNYFSILSMNRLAGLAITTLPSAGTFSVFREPTQSSFSIQRINRNNHEQVWSDNYNLYSNFSWYDTSFDGSIIKVHSSHRQHYERRRREFLNYHPDSYQEIFSSSTKNREHTKICGSYLCSNPNNVNYLIMEEWEETIAKLESAATARQIICLAIIAEAKEQVAFGSQSSIRESARKFSKNFMTQSPFNSKLRVLFLEELGRLSS